MPDAQIFQMFSKPLYTKVLDIDTKKIVSMMNEDGFYNSYDAEFSDDSIGQVTASEHVLDDKKYKFLKDKMMEEFYNFIREEMKYPNELEITTSWFTKTTRGQASPMHNHDNCMFSCVLYLQTSQHSGDIVFENFETQRYHLEPDDYNLYNSTDWSIKPVDGLLIIFPAEVHHAVVKNQSDTVRHSMGFNLIPLGVYFGDG